jgi:lipoprotein-anchoring transpeptidase ErfK/SrfK
MADEPNGRGGLRSRKTLLVVLAVLVPVIPLVIGIAIGFGQPGTGSAATNTTTTTAGFTPVALGAAAITKLKGSTPAHSALPGGSGALVAQLKHPTPLRSSPRGHELVRLTTRTGFGSPEVLLVVNHVPGWLGVVSTEGGNNRVAWIAQSAASLHRVPWELKVSLPARRLTVLKGGHVVARYTVAIGAPGAPTPTGRFAVTDRLQTGDPAGPYGCCILALSAKSPHAIQGWSGGNRIAIHSTPESSSIGEPVSHGCVRVTLPEGRWLLAHIPLGTPTLISS